MNYYKEEKQSKRGTNKQRMNIKREEAYQVEKDAVKLKNSYRETIK